jgi:hypothetical protein
MTTGDYLTGILVFITAIYAYLTNRMARAAESSVLAVMEQSEAMLRPYVTISPWVRPHASFFYLRIANTGRTAAENLHLSIDRDFFQWGETTTPDGNLRNKTAFSQPIDSLAPGTDLLFALAQSWIVLGKDAKNEITPPQFSVTATYQYLGKKVTEVTRIDLRPYIGSEGEHDPVVEELEKIRKVLEKKI